MPHYHHTISRKLRRCLLYCYSGTGRKGYQKSEPADRSSARDAKPNQVNSGKGRNKRLFPETTCFPTRWLSRSWEQCPPRGGKGGGTPSLSENPTLSKKLGWHIEPFDVHSPERGEFPLPDSGQDGLGGNQHKERIVFSVFSQFCNNAKEKVSVRCQHVIHFSTTCW